MDLPETESPISAGAKAEMKRNRKGNFHRSDGKGKRTETRATFGPSRPSDARPGRFDIFGWRPATEIERTGRGARSPLGTRPGSDAGDGIPERKAADTARWSTRSAPPDERHRSSDRMRFEGKWGRQRCRPHYFSGIALRRRLRSRPRAGTGFAAARAGNAPPRTFPSPPHPS